MHTSFGDRDSLCLLKETAKEKAKHGPLTLLALRPSLPAWVREVFYNLISATLKKKSLEIPRDAVQMHLVSSRG